MARHQFLLWIALLSCLNPAVMAQSPTAQDAPKPSFSPLADRLKQLGTALPADQWAMAQQPWTAAMLVQVAELLGGKEPAQKAVEGWVDSAAIIWWHRQVQGPQVGVGLVRLVDAKATRTYFGLAVDLQRQRDLLPGQQILKSDSRSVRIAAADKAILFERLYPSPTGQGTPVSLSTLMVRKGDMVAEITWYGLPPDTVWANKVVRFACQPAKKQ